MEILNDAIVTPQRLHALLKLVKLLKQCTRDELQEYLQPGNLREDGNKQASSVTIRHAIKYGLIVEEDKKILLSDEIPENIEDVETYRNLMQTKLTGIIHPDNHNYLLCRFTAWYAVQNERILGLKTGDITSRFSKEVDENEQDAVRAFNETKFNGWRNWAVFLGWGYSYTLGKDVFIPDANKRLHSLLPTLIPDNASFSMDSFMRNLAGQCPELDGGVLFEECWRLSRPTEIRGQQISLMLSNALRVSEGQGRIRLFAEADAGSIWGLASAQGTTNNRISHIQRIELNNE